MSLDDFVHAQHSASIPVRFFVRILLTMLRVRHPILRPQDAGVAVRASLSSSVSWSLSPLMICCVSSECGPSGNIAGTWGGLARHLRSLRGSFARMRRRTAACGKTPASSTSWTACTHSAVALSVMKKSMLLAELVGLPVWATTPCTMFSQPEEAKVSGVMLASQATIHLPSIRDRAAASSSRIILFSGLRPSPCLKYKLMTVQPPKAVVWVKTAL